LKCNCQSRAGSENGHPSFRPHRAPPFAPRKVRAGRKWGRDNFLQSCFSGFKMSTQFSSPKFRALRHLGEAGRGLGHARSGLTPVFPIRVPRPRDIIREKSENSRRASSLDPSATGPLCHGHPQAELSLAAFPVEPFIAI